VATRRTPKPAARTRKRPSTPTRRPDLLGGERSASPNGDNRTELQRTMDANGERPATQEEFDALFGDLPRDGEG
jgi:hypothetical protein